MTLTTHLSNGTTVVVGASRGLGRGIASALASADIPVVAVARSAAGLADLADEAPGIRTEVADATDPALAGVLLDRYDPQALILVAGATPLMRPLHHQTWETFSGNWHADVRITFNWIRESLLKPLRPGSLVVVISSGAALGAGSPLSGGYAGAKATQRFITNYAREESDRANLGITFTAVFPQLTPMTELGRPAVQAYAARAGQSEQAYLRQLGEPLTPQGAGGVVVGLVRADAGDIAPEYLLSAAGLQPLPPNTRPPAVGSRTDRPVPAHAGT